MANKMPSITLQGDEELMQLLTSLPERTLTACSQGFRRAAKPIIAAAKANLTKRHGLALGLLRKSIGVRALKVDRNKSQIVMFVGPRGPVKQGFKGKETGYHNRAGKFIKVKKNHIPLKIAALVEFGHRIAVSNTTGRGEKDHVLRPKPGQSLAANVGFVKARPFLRPAVDANRGNFLTVLKESLKKEIEKRASKAADKAGAT